MEEFLPLAEMFEQCIGWGRHIGSIRQGATRSTNPILRATELSWGGVIAPNPGHELFVQFTHEAKGERESFQPFQTILQSRDVISNLAQVNLLGS